MTDTPSKQFAGCVVIITGASSGLGLATARAFANEGAGVVLAARNAKRLEQAAAELQTLAGDRVLAVPCDVSKRDEVDALVRRTIDRFNRLDILVNNAGTGLIAPFELVQIQDAIALFETNFFGAFNCTQAVLPHMKRQRHGRIVNMASLAGLRGIPNSSMYSASKAALIAFSDALRIEVKPFGITVTTICPSRTPDTATGLIANAKKYGPIQLYEVPATLSIDMVVRALLNAAARGTPLVILPFHARLLHTINKFAPRFVDRYFEKRMPELGRAQSQPHPTPP